MAAAFQILGGLAFRGAEFRNLTRGARQKLLIAMDCLAGCLVYSVSTVKGEYDEATRKGFLLTHGKRFISHWRANRIFRTGGKLKTMKADADPLLDTP